MREINFTWLQAHLDFTWLMSAITITSMWLAGGKRLSAWVLGLINQVLWVTYIYQKQAWGFVPMTAALTFVYSRNLLKWHAERAAQRTRVAGEQQR